MALYHPRQYQWMGDTLGIMIPLRILGPTLNTLFLAVALYWVFAASRRPVSQTTTIWTAKNQRWFYAFIALLPLQSLLLRLGAPHSVLDKEEAAMARNETCVFDSHFLRLFSGESHWIDVEEGRCCLLL